MILLELYHMWLLKFYYKSHMIKESICGLSELSFIYYSQALFLLMMTMIERLLDRPFMTLLTFLIKPGKTFLMTQSFWSKAFYKKTQKREWLCRKHYNILGLSRKIKQFLLKEESQETDLQLINSKRSQSQRNFLRKALNQKKVNNWAHLEK